MNTKVCSKCREVKLLSEFSKDKASKDGHRYECKVCVKEYNAEYYASNSEKGIKYASEYRAANSEEVKDYQAEYRAANPDYHAKWCAANPDYHAEYQKANPEKCRAWCSNRRAVKLEAIPSWLTEEDWQSMEAIGKEADRLTKETGIKHEVDHIHPLRGKLICGLQCPTNLQILTKSQNCSKGNRFTPYVESESVTESSNFHFLLAS